MFPELVEPAGGRSVDQPAHGLDPTKSGKHLAELGRPVCYLVTRCGHRR